MATTIAIKSDTLKMLKSVKEETNAESFDETIQGLISKVKVPKKSFLGKYKQFGTFKREEIDRFD